MALEVETECCSVTEDRKPHEVALRVREFPTCRAQRLHDPRPVTDHFGDPNPHLVGCGQACSCGALREFVDGKWDERAVDHADHIGMAKRIADAQPGQAMCLAEGSGDHQIRVVGQ